MKNIDAILSTYDELYNRTDGDGAVLSVLTLATVLEDVKASISQQTEIIKILCSNVNQINITLDNIEDDLDGRLEDIAESIDGVKGMMLDTLGSAKSGDALDALAALPGIVGAWQSVQSSPFDHVGKSEPDWMKEA